MTKLKLPVALIVAGMAVTIIYQLRTTHALLEENRGLREQAAQAEQLRIEIEHMSKPGDQTSKQVREQEKVESLRLRGQVGVLRKQLAEAGGARETSIRRRGQSRRMQHFGNNLRFSGTDPAALTLR